MTSSPSGTDQAGVTHAKSIDADRVLPLDLGAAVATLAERANVCHLVSLADLDDILPARSLSLVEANRLLTALADAGLHVIEPDAAARIAS